MIYDLSIYILKFIYGDGLTRQMPRRILVITFFLNAESVSLAVKVLFYCEYRIKAYDELIKSFIIFLNKINSNSRNIFLEN